MYAGFIIRLVSTWLLLAGLYIVLAGQTSADELTAAGIAGGMGAALSAAIAAPPRHRFAPGLAASLRAVLPLPWIVAKQTAIVGWLLLQPRRPSGQFDQETAQQNDDTTAVQILAASLAPNGFVVERTKHDRLLMHRLGQGR